MRNSPKNKKIFTLIKNILRILCVVIFIHWIFWFTTYARVPQYYEAIKDQDQKITHHEQKTPKYNGAGWLSKKEEKTIGEIEEDVLEQIEDQTKKKGLSREWNKQLPELKKLDQEIKELEKKTSRSESEEKALTQKRKDYETKLSIAKKETIQNIQNQLQENKLKIIELNDKRNFFKRLLIDPLSFFLINPLNKTSKVSKITTFFWTEMIFKIVVVKLFCLWLSYPESINAQIQAHSQKAQNPQLSVEEREQSQREASSLFKYWFFNNGIVSFFLPMAFFFHPAHFDRTSEIFRNKIPYRYLLVPLLIIPFFLSLLTAESLRQGRTLSKREIKTYLVQNGIMFIGIFLLIALFAWQSQGNYYWLLFGFGVDFLFNLVRIKILRKTGLPPGTFKVFRVKSPGGSK